jgi:hypothetical protein
MKDSKDTLIFHKGTVAEVGSFLLIEWWIVDVEEGRCEKVG